MPPFDYHQFLSDLRRHTGFVRLQLLHQLNAEPLTDTEPPEVFEGLLQVSSGVEYADPDPVCIAPPLLGVYDTDKAVLIDRLWT